MKDGRLERTKQTVRVQLGSHKNPPKMGFLTIVQFTLGQFLFRRAFMGMGLSLDLGQIVK